MKKLNNHLKKNLPPSEKLFRNWGEVIRTLGALLAVIFTFCTLVIQIIILLTR